MAENNTSQTNSTKMNDETTNSLESQTQTTSITLRASNVLKYLIMVEAKNYICHICKETNSQYNTVIKKNGHRKIMKFMEDMC